MYEKKPQIYRLSSTLTNSAIAHSQETWYVSILNLKHLPTYNSLLGALKKLYLSSFFELLQKNYPVTQIGLI